MVLEGDPLRVVRVIQDGDEELRVTPDRSAGQRVRPRAILAFRATSGTVPRTLRDLKRQRQVEILDTVRDR